MLSLPQPSLASAIGTSSLPLNGENAESSPEHRAPAISVIRPSRVSASVDDSALELLRAKYNAAHYRDRSSSLSAGRFVQSADQTDQASRSTETSPKLQRKNSFRVKKLFRTSSNGMEGYEPLQGDFTEDIQFRRERITSVNRVLSRNSSFTSNGPCSPRPYRAMSLVPAKHRVVQCGSSDEDDDEGDSSNGLISPASESDLDFGPGTRSKGSQVNHNTIISQWKSLLLSDHEEELAGESSGGKKATAGSRGKSANSMMMKLAKKFSKKNLPINRDEDGDGSSIGGDSLGKGDGKLKSKRSNSVSNLDSLGGMGRRSHSMEHLAPMGANQGRSGSASLSTPQGSPRMVRSWSKGKLNRRSAELENESSVSNVLQRTAGKQGDPTDALFEAIEQGNLESVASLIEAKLVTKFNTSNEDEFLAVDLSVMLGHHDIAKLLLKIGAKDSPKFCRDPYSRYSRITALISEAERDLYRLRESYASVSASSGVKEVEKRYKKGERRLQVYQLMLRNYQRAGVPGPPTNVQLHVTSGRSLMVTFSEPEQINHATVTRYKIEWCVSKDFKPVVGDFIMTDLRSMEYIIPDLDNGERYFVRVSAYNMKGFGPYVNSSPPSAIPSSWHDAKGSRPRYEGCTDKIHLVSAQFGLTLQNPDPPSGSGLVSPVATSSKPKVKKANPLSRMFANSAKFHKLLKPGVFLASLVYSKENKILVTTDETVPIVEVSESTSASIGADFVWLAKLACSWEQVQVMCDISDDYTSSPSVQFRNKLLHAVVDLQNALGVLDLGLLHPVPYKDSHGAIVFVVVQYVNETKNVAAGNSSLKWSDLSKLWKRRTPPTRTTGLDAFPVPDQVILDAQEIIAHHYTSIRPLDKGLYLGYLKARSSVASMKVICSREYPSVLPHIRLRDNPNLSKEEWEWIAALKTPMDQHSPDPPPMFTNPQHLQNTFLPSLTLFLKNLGFTQEEADAHQLYVHEIIELNEDVTVLLVLPPPDQVCTAPGSSDHFAELADFVAMPINTFEIMQLYTYQRSFMTKFATVATRLEVELLTSHQRMREAFSNAEIAAAKEKAAVLEDYSTRTEQTWKKMRWIEDAVQKGRDHEATYDTLLPLSLVRQNVELQAKEVARLQQEAKKREEAPPMQTAKEASPEEPRHGYLRVIPTYRTGLTRGTSVKLYIESITTTQEVISLVVNQVAEAIGAGKVVDFSDFYLVATFGSKEWTLPLDYHPLQLQANPTEGAKVFLSLKKRSEENHQMITSV